jgi:hypothetical protein
MSTGGNMVTWILRGCAIIFTLMMFFGSWNGFVENQQFKSHGQKALIEPLEGYTETTTTKKKLGITISEYKSHSAELFFLTQDKQRIKVNKVIPDELLKQFLAGEAVYIEYLPESPTLTRFPGQSLSPFLAAVLGLLSLAITYFLWRKM